jgi:ribosomal protein L9
VTALVPEGASYGMAALKYRQKPLLGFRAAQQHLSIFPFSSDVVEAVRDQTGVELERRQLDSEPIKALGQHTVTAKLHSDVSFPITVDVVSV